MKTDAHLLNFHYAGGECGCKISLHKGRQVRAHQSFCNANGKLLMWQLIYDHIIAIVTDDSAFSELWCLQFVIWFIR